MRTARLTRLLLLEGTFAAACWNVSAHHGQFKIPRGRARRRNRVSQQKWPRSLGADCMNPNLTASPSRGAQNYFFFLGAFFFAGLAAFFVAFFID